MSTPTSTNTPTHTPPSNLPGYQVLPPQILLLIPFPQTFWDIKCCLHKYTYPYPSLKTYWDVNCYLHKHTYSYPSLKPSGISTATSTNTPTHTPPSNLPGYQVLPPQIHLLIPLPQNLLGSQVLTMPLNGQLGMKQVQLTCEGHRRAGDSEGRSGVLHWLLLLVCSSSWNTCLTARTKSVDTERDNRPTNNDPLHLLDTGLWLFLKHLPDRSHKVWGHGDDTNISSDPACTSLWIQIWHKNQHWPFHLSLLDTCL